MPRSDSNEGTLLLETEVASSELATGQHFLEADTAATMGSVVMEHL